MSLTLEHGQRSSSATQRKEAMEYRDNILLDVHDLSKDGKMLSNPISSMSTYHTRLPTRRHAPHCGHLTMTRLYHVAYRCEQCSRLGSFGWLYRCTQDREVLIQDSRRRGLRVSGQDDEEFPEAN
jgi:hypothetical protein